MKKLLFLFISLFLFTSCEEEPPEAIETYSLQVTVNPEEGGTVTPSSGTFNENEEVSIIASPSPEYVFSDWTGSISSQSNPLTVIMNSDKSLVANFNKRTYPLTINIEGEGTVSETSQSFESGSEVTLTAIPEQGWKFVEWKGDITSTDNPITIVVNSSKEITAVFEKLNLLSLIINGQGTIEKRIDGELTEDSLFSAGTTIELTAIPSENWEFKEWTGDITSTENPVQITIEESKTVNLKFMRYFNYKMPSHDWKRDVIPWIDYKEVVNANNDFNYDEISSTATGFGDFNRDGYLDFMTQNVPNQTEWNMFLWSDSQFIIDNSIISNPEFQVTTGARKTVTNDFNGDNLPDVIRIDGGHDVLGYTNITLSKGDGSYDLKNIIEVPETQYHGFASGDIDNDGDVDLFFGEPKSGFAINDGNANFTWFGVHEKIDNYFKDVTEQDGPYGIATVEIVDVNKDGNLDIVVGGRYKDELYDQNLTSPTILWGDGTGNFDYNNRTEVWNFGEKPSHNSKKVDNNDDIVIGDIDGDGINDVVLLYIFQIDNDPNNNGNTTMYSMINVFKGNSDNSFTNRTDEWLDDYVKGFPMTWLLLRDIDNNGFIDIVESESKIWRPGNWTGNSNSIRYEWNGTKFQKIN